MESIAGEFNVTGGNGSGLDAGLDGQATINGESLTSSSNSFTSSTRRFSATVDFVEGFSGTFDTITVDNTFSFEPSERSIGFAVPGVDGHRFSSLRLQGIGATALGGDEGTLSMLAAGQILGNLNDAASSAVSIADAALTELDSLLSTVDSFQTDTLDAANTALESEQTSINSSITVLKNKIEAAQAAADTREKLVNSTRASNRESAISSLLSSLSGRQNTIASLLRPLS